MYFGTCAEAVRPDMPCLIRSFLPRLLSRIYAALLPRKPLLKQDDQVLTDIEALFKPLYFAGRLAQAFARI